MTRSLKQDGAPTVASRWIQRIEQLATGLSRHNELTKSEYLGWARGLDAAPAVPRIRRPEPRPAAKIEKLSVTEIETWLRDPYAIYAKHILRLEPLDPLAQEPGPLERGIAVHKALEEFFRAHPNDLPADALNVLMGFGEAAFRDAGATDEVLALWRPRFLRAARWFVDYERDRRTQIARSYAEERGKLEIERAGGTFRLTCRADRIDIHPDGAASILDYKTGKAPSSSQIETLLSPQLPLEAAMLMNGGFEGVAAARIHQLIHIQLKGAEPVGKEAIADLDPEAVARAALERLKNRIAEFDAWRPFRSRVMVFKVTDVGDYDQLARVREWAVVEDDPMATPP
jgi:ATP-dependent helicase/nuclease subunit B